MAAGQAGGRAIDDVQHLAGVTRGAAVDRDAFARADQLGNAHRALAEVDLLDLAGLDGQVETVALEQRRPLGVLHRRHVSDHQDLGVVEVIGQLQLVIGHRVVGRQGAWRQAYLEGDLAQMAAPDVVARPVPDIALQFVGPERLELLGRQHAIQATRELHPPRPLVIGSDQFS